jgi:arabinose-5-phosphate isomerase
MADDADSPIDFARRVLDAEAAAVAAVTVDESFVRATTLLAELPGNLIISGLGKSGLIAQKLSATFASTGTPSHFLHPVEAMHGDLGRVRRGDAVLLLSYSGQSEEVVTLAELLRPDDVPTLAIVRGADCDLGRAADVVLCVGDVAEACPHNLAPTASTTAMLALGDALALAVSRQRGFSADDFQKRHPGGGLGRLLRPVTEAMRFRVAGPDGSPGNLPTMAESTTLGDAYEQAERHARDAGIRRAGALLVVSDNGQLTGIFTDGDLRRLVQQHDRPLAQQLGDVMTRSPRTLRADQLVRDAVHAVREKRIDEVPVISDDGRPLGLIDVQDLVALKVIEG